MMVLANFEVFSRDLIMSKSTESSVSARITYVSGMTVKNFDYFSSSSISSSFNNKFILAY